MSRAAGLAVACALAAVVAGAGCSSRSSPGSDAGVSCPESASAYCASGSNASLPECAPDLTTALATCGIGGVTYATCGSYVVVSSYFSNETYSATYYDTTTKQRVAVFENGDCAGGPSPFVAPLGCTNTNTCAARDAGP